MINKLSKTGSEMKRSCEVARISSGGEVRVRVVEQGALPLHAVLFKPLPKKAA